MISPTYSCSTGGRSAPPRTWRSEGEEARVFAQPAPRRANEINHVIQIADAQRVLGIVSMRQGDYPGAARWLQCSLATWRKLRLPGLYATRLSWLPSFGLNELTYLLPVNT